MLSLSNPEMLLKTTLVFKSSRFPVNYYKFNLLTAEPNMKGALNFHQRLKITKDLSWHQHFLTVTFWNLTWYSFIRFFSIQSSLRSQFYQAKLEADVFLDKESDLQLLSIFSFSLFKLSFIWSETIACVYRKEVCIPFRGDITLCGNSVRILLMSSEQLWIL